MTTPLPKGYHMEELLRRYFIRSGYFTVRGVPFVYEGFDVTDIDLWLYDRPSAISRHRVIVDTKNRSTPKAIERIFWVKGLQQVLHVEQAIVATTDKRPAVSQFGREQGIVILDGTFFDRLEKSSEPFESRLTEEEFIGLLASYRPSKEGGDWKARFRGAKHPLVSNLGYNAINGWLIDAKFFAEQAQLVKTHQEVALRILYVLLSYIAIAFDFVTKDQAFSETSTKLAAINDGLRYGSQGATGTQRLIELATGLIEQYAPEQRMLAPRIRERFIKELDAIPTKPLAEYFSKPSVSQELFSVAKELESAAYRAKFLSPQELPATAKGMIGLFLDFWGLDRKRFFQSSTTADHPSAARSQPPQISQNSLPGLETED